MKKRADGRYAKRIDGKWFYGKTERELYKKLLEYTTEKEVGVKFEKVAIEWWEESYERFSPQTLRGYVPAYKRAVEMLADLRIPDVTPKDIQLIFKKMAAQGFSRKTISNQRIIYNQIFDYAVINGYISFNPCSSVKVLMGRKSEAIKPALDLDEKKILESDHPWQFPFMALLTGMRKQELLALQWKDIDFDENIISVTKAVEHIGKTPHIKSTKTEAGVRDVPMINRLRERLISIKGNPNHYIFSDDGGKNPLSEHRFERLYKDYAKEVGITCSSRQLRHSFATVAVEEDIQAKDLQNALGHADITTTMNVYASARKKSIQKVADKLNHRYDA